MSAEYNIVTEVESQEVIFDQRAKELASREAAVARSNELMGREDAIAARENTLERARAANKTLDQLIPAYDSAHVRAIKLKALAEAAEAQAHLAELGLERFYFEQVGIQKANLDRTVEMIKIEQAQIKKARFRSGAWDIFLNVLGGAAVVAGFVTTIALFFILR